MACKLLNLPNILIIIFLFLSILLLFSIILPILFSLFDHPVNLFHFNIFPTFFAIIFQSIYCIKIKYTSFRCSISLSFLFWIDNYSSLSSFANFSIIILLNSYSCAHSCLFLSSFSFLRSISNYLISRFCLKFDIVGGLREPEGLPSKITQAQSSGLPS